MITLIAAISENNAIGKNNELLWHIPTDLKHFKHITTGKTVVMGRKTFESIGKPLPNRKNVVVTRSNIEIDGVTVVHSLEDALKLDDDIMVIGGAEIYKQTIDVADVLYITNVEDIVDGADAFFPEISNEIWRTVDAAYYQKTDKYPSFMICKMERK